MYGRAIEVVPYNTTYMTNQALTLLKLNRYVCTVIQQPNIYYARHDEVIAICDRALRIDEKCLKALVHRSSARLAMMQFNEAIADLEEALKVAPNNTETARMLASAKGAKEEAERETRALALAEDVCFIDIIVLILHNRQPTQE